MDVGWLWVRSDWTSLERNGTASQLLLDTAEVALGDPRMDTLGFSRRGAAAAAAGSSSPSQSSFAAAFFRFFNGGGIISAAEDGGAASFSGRWRGGALGSWKKKLSSLATDEVASEAIAPTAADSMGSAGRLTPAVVGAVATSFIVLSPDEGATCDGCSKAPREYCCCCCGGGGGGGGSSKERLSWFDAWAVDDAVSVTVGSITVACGGNTCDGGTCDCEDMPAVAVNRFHCCGKTGRICGNEAVRIEVANARAVSQ